MNISILTLFANHKHGILMGLFALWVTFIAAWTLVDRVFPDKSDDSVQPSPTTPTPDGCVRMPDGIKICDSAAQSADATASGHVDHRAFDTRGLTPICGLGRQPHFRDVHNLRHPKPEAYNALHWMVQRVGLSPNFKILAGDFLDASTAFAALRNNQRYIVYDVKKNFMEPNGKLTWQSLGVLGHELGHHLAGHTGARNLPNHDRELEADKFAGFILAKLGASQAQASGWTSILSVNGSLTHPPRVKRKQAAIDGWMLARQFGAPKNSACHNGWLGDSIFIEAQTCRIAQRCINGQSTIQLACETAAGEWHWVE